MALPDSWDALSASANLSCNFDAALPGEFPGLFSRVIAEVHAILGGGFDCHVVATHTHRQEAAGPSAVHALSAVSHLTGGRLLRHGDYCTSEAVPRGERMILLLQYDTICPAHRRSVIAHEYSHVHQMTLLREKACGEAHDNLPMWLVEGCATLFEHLYIAEYWPGLRRGTGLAEAVNRTLDLGLTFDATKETYNAPSVNYYVESVAVLFLAHSRGLLPKLHVLVTDFWRELYAAEDWRKVFASLFGCSPADFYAELNTFLASPRSEQVAIVPSASANVLRSCCREGEREARGLCATPGRHPRTGEVRNVPGCVRVAANLGVRGSGVGVVLTTA